MDIDTNMKMVGKRYPYYATYKVRSVQVSWSSLPAHHYRLDALKMVYSMLLRCLCMRMEALPIMTVLCL